MGSNFCSSIGSSFGSSIDSALPDLLESLSIQVCIIQEFLLILNLVSFQFRFLVRDLLQYFGFFSSSSYHFRFKMPLPCSVPDPVPSSIPNPDPVPSQALTSTEIPSLDPRSGPSSSVFSSQVPSHDPTSSLDPSQVLRRATNSSIPSSPIPGFIQTSTHICRTKEVPILILLNPSLLLSPLPTVNVISIQHPVLVPTLGLAPFL